MDNNPGGTAFVIISVLGALGTFLGWIGKGYLAAKAQKKLEKDEAETDRAKVIDDRFAFLQGMINDLKVFVADLRDELDKERKRRQALDQDLREAERQLNEAQKRIDELENENDALRKELNKLKMEVENNVQPGN